MPARKSVLFLTPEKPALGRGGGGIRSASLLAYLRTRYDVDVASFDLIPHSKSAPARAFRNAMRLIRGTPPLFDRYSGYESQLAAQIRSPRYACGVLEHFWCASYADLLRRWCDGLVLDLHNIESELARTHAAAARWPESWASANFAKAYERLERDWYPKFDVILVSSEEDRKRVDHRNVIVYPNALPVIDRPAVYEAGEAIIFTGNLEYHPNIEAVRWFRGSVWPVLRERAPKLEWRIAGVNPGAIEGLVSGDPRIKLLGPVEDAVAALAQAKVAVVPLLSGSGTRFKILEAWAASRAVVSTMLGAEGLGVRSGEHLLIAEGAENFANAVLGLLADAAQRARLGEAGRNLYLDRFTWPAAWRNLDGPLTA
jgi:polysaccharide biosynthesis protein PslH